MNYYTFRNSDFSYPEEAIKVAIRMGWMPEQDCDELGYEGFTITYPDEDYNLVRFIFDYYM